jgi:hypothetical protein
VIRFTAQDFRTGSGQPRRASPVKDTRPVQESLMYGGGTGASKPSGEQKGLKSGSANDINDLVVTS